MSLINTIKSEIIVAMKAKDQIRKDILRVALGEIEKIESREGSISEPEVQKILRKMIASNNETIAAAPDKDNSKLLAENEILDELLPKMWDAEKVRAFLSEDIETLAVIKSADNDGPATGAAMKALKAVNAPVDGKVVSQIARELRAQG